MSSPRILPVVLPLLFAIEALGGCSSATASGTGHSNPCSLLTQAQVVALTGGPVRKAMPTGTGDGCNWAAINGAKVSLLITLQDNQTPVLFAQQEHLATQTSGNVHDLPAIADDAFAYSAQDGTVQSAEARKGNLGVRILLTGEGANAESAKQALVTALKNSGA